MRLVARSVVLAATLASLAACGGGDRQMLGSWEVRIDPDRSAKLELSGSFTVSEDTTSAEAGETDISVETFGSITATNLSSDRDFQGISTGLELFVPIKWCPDSEATKGSRYCARDLVSFTIPDLEPGASEEIPIAGNDEVASVPTADGPAVVKAMNSKASVVVSADRVFGNHFLEELNSTCKFNPKPDETGTWVTYYSERKSVTACSTEPPYRKPRPKPSATPAPEESAEPVNFTMPSLVGQNLQLAQDMLQALGSYVLQQDDALGLSRFKVLDSNWKVCTQQPQPGATVPVDDLVILGAVKLAENCP